MSNKYLATYLKKQRKGDKSLDKKHAISSNTKKPWCFLMEFRKTKNKVHKVNKIAYQNKK